MSNSAAPSSRLRSPGFPAKCSLSPNSRPEKKPTATSEAALSATLMLRSISKRRLEWRDDSFFSFQFSVVSFWCVDEDEGALSRGPGSLRVRSRKNLWMGEGKYGEENNAGSFGVFVGFAGICRKLDRISGEFQMLWCAG